MSGHQILALCAGYGGLEMAVERLIGGRTVAVADPDPSKARILAERHPGTPNLGDITAVDWAQYAAENPDVDVITSGFPCKDISNAGPREGIHGARSGIWTSVLEATRHIRPRFLFLENVAAIRTRGLDVVAEAVAEIGYDFTWVSVRASDYGYAHHRYRWFGLGYPPPPPELNDYSKLLRQIWVEMVHPNTPTNEKPGDTGRR